MRPPGGGVQRTSGAVRLRQQDSPCPRFLGLILVLGFVFETPIIIMGLAEFGIVSARGLLGFWRYALVLAFVISAVATPTPDPITQTLVAGPIVVLYFLGIGLAWFVRRD